MVDSSRLLFLVVSTLVSAASDEDVSPAIPLLASLAPIFSTILKVLPFPALASPDLCVYAMSFIPIKFSKQAACSSLSPACTKSA